MPTPPKNRIAIAAAIQAHGPMSAADLSDITALSRAQVNDAIYKARKSGCFYITAWQRQDEGHQGSLIPIYANGPGRDKPSPGRIPDIDRHARYRRRHAAILRARSTAANKAQSRRTNPFAQLMRLAA